MVATGVRQLSGGHQAGCEAAVHAMRAVFQESNTDAVILVDAKNAFNNLNRQVALYNIQFICPPVAKIMINCYRTNACLFVGGTVLYFREGTTQGDPLAMTMFALATVPLINAIATDETVQAWFADDAASGGRIQYLRQWWDRLADFGPRFCYYPNPAKTHLLVKPEKFDKATDVFGDTGVEISCEGKRYLGGALGTDEYGEKFLAAKVEEWIQEIRTLASFAKTQPYAAYAAFTHGLIGRWTYALRVPTLSSDELLRLLEDVIL